jgi:hypothetical protein
VKRKKDMEDDIRFIRIKKEMWQRFNTTVVRIILDTTEDNLHDCMKGITDASEIWASLQKPLEALQFCWTISSTQRVPQCGPHRVRRG